MPTLGSAFEMPFRSQAERARYGKSYFQQRRMLKRKTEHRCYNCGEDLGQQSFLCRSCQNRNNKARRKRLQKIKDRVFECYGGYRCACKACPYSFGGTHFFFCIDHVNGGGAKHRARLRRQGVLGSTFYEWLLREGFPSGYQVLCHACNQAKSLDGGVCPHKVLDDAEATACT